MLLFLYNAGLLTRGKVDDVDVGEVRDVQREADGTFSVDANWTVRGSVSHFGHTHYRKNRYHALVNMSRRMTPGKFANLLCSMNDGYCDLLAEFNANSHWQYFLPKVE